MAWINNRSWISKRARLLLKTHRLPQTLRLLALALGSYLLISGLWIPTKALVAQLLIEQAWQTSTEADLLTDSKPWPWADTWPVARLQAPEQGIDLYVMEGGHGQALAFGPGRLLAAGNGGDSTIIAGHRDTHFAFLQALALGESLTLTDRQGVARRYRIHELSIEDSDHQQLLVNEGDHLLLVTCYPFDALTSDGSLRYVVRAQLASSPQPDRLAIGQLIEHATPMPTPMP